MSRSTPFYQHISHSFSFRETQARGENSLPNCLIPNKGESRSLLLKKHKYGSSQAFLAFEMIVSTCMPLSFMVKESYNVKDYGKSVWNLQIFLF